MSFALSPLTILAGLGVLAGALYLLQRLRVRHREVPVVTTLFWKQAVEETRARVFVRRFRHLPAYLLFLAIAALLWLGFAQPRADGGGAGRYVLALDGSAGMAWQDRFARAREALRADAAAYPADRTEILFCGGTVRTLLAPGEDRLLLAKRLERVAPEAAPASIERALASRLAARGAPAGAEALHAVLYGDAPAFAKGAPAGLTLERRAFAPARAGNAGVAALGVAEAASGRWDAVDVHAAVRGGARPRADVDGRALPAADEREGGRLLWRDVPARGGLLTLRLPDDDLPLDDVAAVRLPERVPIRVALSPVLAGFDEVLAALQRDPGVELVDDAPYDVEINMMEGDVVPGDPPMLVFRDKPAGAAAIEVLEPTADAAATLADLERALALAEIDGAALAEALGAPARVEVRDDPARAILVAAALLGPDRSFLSSRAFPLFVAGAVRRLAGVQPLRAFVAAGEPLADAPRAHVRAGRVHAPLGLAFVPPQAGDYAAAAGAPVRAALLADALTAAAGEEGSSDAPAAAAGFDAALWVILLAFALLLVEWTLFRAGRVP